MILPRSDRLADYNALERLHKLGALHPLRAPNNVSHFLDLMSKTLFKHLKGEVEKIELNSTFYAFYY